MHRASIFATLSLAATTAFGPVAQAAPPAKKPAPKPAAPGVKGTAQRPGDVGQIGVTYSLPVSSDSSFNLTIHDMYFVATRMAFKGKVVYPEADKKFLVMDGTYQNPNSGKDFGVGTQTIKLTAVDATNANSEDSYDVMNPVTSSDLDISLKPGQKVDFKKYIVVPAGVQIPKLILDWSDPNGKVMRFDLHGVVKAVETIVHDPADTSGTIALATIPNAQVGTTYPCGPLDDTVEKIERTTTALGGNAPEDGKEYVVVTIRSKNQTKEEFDFNNGNGFTAPLLDADGDQINRNDPYLKGSSDDNADTNIPSGIEKRFRIFFTVPRGTGLKTLTMAHGDAYRHLVYDLSGVK